MRNTNVTLNTDDVFCEIETNESNEPVSIVGPFKINNCNYFKYGNTIVAGVAKIIIKSDGKTLEEGEDKDYIILNSKKEIIKDMDAFNKNIKSNFYIKIFNPFEFYNAKLYVKYRGVDCDATVHLLTCDMEGSWQVYGGGSWECATHKGNVQYVNGTAYSTTASQTGTEYYVNSPSSGVFGNYYKVYTATGNTRQQCSACGMTTENSRRCVPS